MRILLFTGKGGVGKTTTAAATAVAAARGGLATVVLSTDAAHSLGDALDVALPDGALTGVEPGLDALQASAATSVESSWRVVQEYLLEVLGSLGLDPVLAEEVTSLPGADELAALSALRGLVAADRHDLVVVDCAPTAETLRLLALPEVLAWHLDRLVPTQRAVLGALRPAALAAVGVPSPPAAVLDAVRAWAVRMREVQAVLTSPASSVRLVLTPEAVVIAESRRTMTSLGLHGYAVDAVVVNRIVPDARDGLADGARPDPWRTAWNAAQQRGIEEVRSSFAGIPVRTVPFEAGEPVGPAALAALGTHLVPEGSAAGLLEPATGAGVRVERSGAGFALRLRIPLVTSADIRLRRRDDDLVIDVAGHHRVVTLPSALRRCVVKGASVVRGELTVTFVPDEEVWPRDRA